ncbi:hypothetical protein [Neptuniibacter caesariensis]|uniref:Uncharacterized protein n=1 Tax=Neptuniibacter caesariensis TaxID=207954 RepID=A0A7U8C8V6_NEPCE|nr:hypothetical protein [Neptuniibacter caesariensis]EAR62225.1 hypothetical protein MED92_14348 [Oceanospirillum sp. MED92] [Neptuniibacter caesariensis]
MDSEKCKINFKCPESWGDLDKTDDPLVRQCGKCAKNVHYCATESELELADEEWCVAVPVDIEDGVAVMMGDIDFADFKDQFSEPQPEDFEPKPCDIDVDPLNQFLDVESDAKK